MTDTLTPTQRYGTDGLTPSAETPGSQVSTAERARRRNRRATADAAEVTPEPIPDGYTAEQWAEVTRLRKSLGKDAETVARDLHRFDNPSADANPVPDDSLPALHEASRKLEQRALKRYMALKTGVGQKLADALSEYQEHRRRSARIMDRIAQ